MGITRAILVVLGLFLDLSSAFQPLRRDVHLTRNHLAALERPSDKQDDTPGIILPVFPLRKTVRLPTEPLTLNLYEDRYLQMAEYILRQPTDRQIFGAMYASNKPQIVRDGGLGPIVPILEVGDVGVVFIITHSEEALIPTVGSDPRRRIRLVGVGSMRFKIRKIIENGYCASDPSDNGSSDNLPFILVEASLVQNDKLSPSEEAQFERLVQEIGVDNESKQRLEALTSKSEKIFHSVMEVEGPSLKADLMSFNICSSRVGEGETQKRLELLTNIDLLDRLRAF